MTTMAQIFDEIDTWEDPTAELTKLSIKGERDNCSACPMANYIISVAPPEVKEIRVDWLQTDVIYRDGHREKYTNPPKMSSFIQDFDNCEIPELDENPRVDWEDDDDYWGEECTCPGCLGED